MGAASIGLHVRRSGRLRAPAAAGHVMELHARQGGMLGARRRQLYRIDVTDMVSNVTAIALDRTHLDP